MAMPNTVRMSVARLTGTAARGDADVVDAHCYISLIVGFTEAKLERSPLSHIRRDVEGL